MPAGPSGRWVLVPVDDGSTLLGGMDRGAFAPYGRYEDDDALRNALHHVLGSPVTPDAVEPAVRAGWAVQARALAATLRARDPASLVVSSVSSSGSGCGVVGTEAGEVALEVLAGVAPVEGLSGLVVPVLEGEQSLL